VEKNVIPEESFFNLSTVLIRKKMLQQDMKWLSTNLRNYVKFSTLCSMPSTLGPPRNKPRHFNLRKVRDDATKISAIIFRF
jgi:hypothetical protein